MLSLEDIRFQRGARFAFSLNVAPGEILAITGPSGIGKSTLLDLIAGFLTPDSGAMTWERRDILPLSPAKRPVSQMFQENDLFEHLTLAENIALGVDARGRITPAVEAALDSVGLAGLGARKPGMVSGGQRRRASLARALIREKPVLLLDEPFSALDADTRGEVIVLARQVAARQNLAVIFVTHDPAEISAMGARHARMIEKDGMIAVSQ